MTDELISVYVDKEKENCKVTHVLKILKSFKTFKNYKYLKIK